MTYLSESGAQSVYENLTTNDYRQRMFSYAETRKAWKFARVCIPKVSGSQIDRYIMERFLDTCVPL